MDSRSDRPCHGVQITLATTPGNRRELLQTLEEFRNRAQGAATDCACDLFEDLAEANRFLWVEWWVTAAQARETVTTQRFRALLGAVRVLGRVESLQWVDRTDEPWPPANDFVPRGPGS